MKSNVVLPPPSEFQRADFYSRKCLRHVQYWVNQFWLRWRKEYLQSLQTRNKWSKDQRSLSVGDVVIVLEPDVPRNKWSLAREVETFQSDDGLVRSAKVQVGNRCLDKHGRREREMSYLVRPIHKLILLVEAWPGNSPLKSRFALMFFVQWQV